MMLIDNEKFIGLLVENTGIEQEKVEKYLEELVNDIKTAFEEGDGYEVEGFGVFSKLGASVIFIPSEELETEINYKYVGMEAIELPGSTSEKVEVEEENPLQGILDGDKSEESDDPFADLIGEDDDSDLDEEEKTENVFSSTDEDVENEDALNEFIGNNDDATASEQSEEEIEMPGPDKWGIDAHKEEDHEDAFSGLFGGSPKEKDTTSEEEDIFDPDEEEVDQKETAKKEDEIDFSALEDETSEDEDFDDPFMDLEDEDDSDNDKVEDFVPVVTNVSSEKKSKEKDKKKEEAPVKSEEKKSKKIKPPKDKSKSSPVLLYLVLALVIVAGSGYLLAYFGVVNIQGITPTNNNSVAQVTPPPTNNNQSQPVIPEETVANNESLEKRADLESPQNTNPDDMETDIAPKIADEKSPGNGGIITPTSVQAGAEPYGLTGTATETGNNGYTIVLYTLSIKNSADAQFEKLSKDGYRVIIKERPSNTYGVLYRVSIGQFKSLAAAAMAAEKVDPDILGNYIITKI